MFKSTKLICIAAGAAFAFQAASAQAQTYNWSGFYAGVNGGYGWGDADTDGAFGQSVRTRVFRTAGPTLISDVTAAGAGVAAGASSSVDGWFLGGQIGYNWQAASWVFGLETDLQKSWQDGSAGCVGGCGGGLTTFTASTKLDWFGTLRARAGYLIQSNTMLYATAGLAYGHVTTDYAATAVGAPGGAFSDGGTKTGWAAGGGIESALSRNWLIRAEYLYIDLGETGNGSGSSTSSVNFLNTPGAGFNTLIDTTNTAATRTRFTDQIFRVGLSYKFN